MMLTIEYAQGGRQAQAQLSLGGVELLLAGARSARRAQRAQRELSGNPHCRQH
jgi:hypothetical protein